MVKISGFQSDDWGSIPHGTMVGQECPHCCTGWRRANDAGNGAVLGREAASEVRILALTLDV